VRVGFGCTKDIVFEERKLFAEMLVMAVFVAVRVVGVVS
jgi:hypothetical protein